MNATVFILVSLSFPSDESMIVLVLLRSVTFLNNRGNVLPLATCWLQNFKFATQSSHPVEQGRGLKMEAAQRPGSSVALVASCYLMFVYRSSIETNECVISWRVHSMNHFLEFPPTWSCRKLPQEHLPILTHQRDLKHWMQQMMI